MERKKFIKHVATAFFALQAGRAFALTGNMANQWAAKKNRLRFAVLSDGHYGEAGTTYHENYTNVINAVEAQHQREPFHFCVFNGDLVHNDSKWYPDVKELLGRFTMPCYVTPGNHDRVTASEWEQIWGTPVNHDVVIGKVSLLLATTSDEKGNYICPDLQWLEQKLEANRYQQHVLLFLHITPKKWTVNGIDCPQLHQLLQNYPNVRAVFNGHDHDQDAIKWLNNIPYLFDAHVGGSWGTSYKGYRVVELKQDGSLYTYIMNPTQAINSENLIA